MGLCWCWKYSGSFLRYLKLKWISIYITFFVAMVLLDATQFHAINNGTNLRCQQEQYIDVNYLQLHHNVSQIPVLGNKPSGCLRLSSPILGKIGLFPATKDSQQKSILVHNTSLWLHHSSYSLVNTLETFIFSVWVYGPHHKEISLRISMVHLFIIHRWFKKSII